MIASKITTQDISSPLVKEKAVFRLGAVRRPSAKVSTNAEVWYTVCMCVYVYVQCSVYPVFICVLIHAPLALEYLFVLYIYIYIYI